MLDQSTLDQLKEVFGRLENTVQIETYGNDQELLDFLSEIKGLNDKIQFVRLAKEDLDSYAFAVKRSGEEARIFFRGIPGGHEFTSLVLAILQLGGNPLKIDVGIQKVVKEIDQKLELETFVSLDCHNCPEVVQTLNAFAVLNPHIQHTMIDGALYPSLVESRKIQGVPAVFLNGQPLFNGKVEVPDILEKLTGGSTPRESKVSEDLQDVIVIGGGPGGVASAIYAIRKGLKVTLLAQKLGGQVKDTFAIENLISMHYTTGPELTQSLRELLEKNEVKVREMVKVERLNKEGHINHVYLSTGEILQSRSVVIATGAKWRELGVPGEKDYLGKGVAFCPHCDGPFFKGKRVAVVGGGNSGVEAALDLAGITQSVVLVEFLHELKADQILQDKMRSTPNIEILTGIKTVEILGDGSKVVGMVYEDRNSGQQQQLNLDGIFVQIGLLPNSGFVQGYLETNRFGEIAVDTKNRTSVEGVFACGDVTNTPYKQIAIAMGEGAKTGIAVFEYLLTGQHQSVA